MTLLTNARSFPDVTRKKTKTKGRAMNAHATRMNTATVVVHDDGKLRPERVRCRAGCEFGSVVDDLVSGTSTCTECGMVHSTGLMLDDGYTFDTEHKEEDCEPKRTSKAKQAYNRMTNRRNRDTSDVTTKQESSASNVTKSVARVYKACVHEEKEQRVPSTNRITKLVRSMLSVPGLNIPSAHVQVYVDMAVPLIADMHSKLKKMGNPEYYAAICVHRVLAEGFGGMNIMCANELAYMVGLNHIKLNRVIKRHGMKVPKTVSEQGASEELKDHITKYANDFLLRSVGAAKIDDNDRRRLSLQLELVWKDMVPTKEFPRGKVTSTPIVIAAAVVYLSVCSFRRTGKIFTQTMVCKACGVSAAACSKAVAAMTPLPALLLA